VSRFPGAAHSISRSPADDELYSSARRCFHCAAREALLLKEGKFGFTAAHPRLNSVLSANSGLEDDILVYVD
jgi:hypothetical protein